LVCRAAARTGRGLAESGVTVRRGRAQPQAEAGGRVRALGVRAEGRVGRGACPEMPPNLEEFDAFALEVRLTRVAGLVEWGAR
jgi:hypothetical protein